MRFMATLKRITGRRKKADKEANIAAKQAEILRLVKLLAQCSCDTAADARHVNKALAANSRVVKQLKTSLSLDYESLQRDYLDYYLKELETTRSRIVALEHGLAMGIIELECRSPKNTKLGQLRTILGIKP